MPDLHRTRTRRQSPRISEVMAESDPQVGGGKAPIVRYAMSRLGSIRKQRAVDRRRRKPGAYREPRGFGESKRAGHRPRAHGPSRTYVSIARTAVTCEDSEAVACTGGERAAVSRAYREGA